MLIFSCITGAALCLESAVVMTYIIFLNILANFITIIHMHKCIIPAYGLYMYLDICLNMSYVDIFKGNALLHYLISSLVKLMI